MKKAACIIGYIITVALVIGALGRVQVYLKRGAQAAMKRAIDDFGNPEDGMASVDPSEEAVTTSQSSFDSQLEKRVTVSPGGGFKLELIRDRTASKYSGHSIRETD
jgi:hypothetical protein